MVNVKKSLLFLACVISVAAYGAGDVLGVRRRDIRTPAEKAAYRQRIEEDKALLRELISPYCVKDSKNNRYLCKVCYDHGRHTYVCMYDMLPHYRISALADDRIVTEPDQIAHVAVLREASGRHPVAYARGVERMEQKRGAQRNKYRLSARYRDNQARRERLKNLRVALEGAVAGAGEGVAHDA